MPDCGLRLVDAQGISVGVAAHIAGARGGGKQGSPSARFDPNMTDDERNALGNLVYVCRNCHEKIDAIPQGERDYPVARLIDIKAKHEGIVDRAMNEALASVASPSMGCPNWKLTNWRPPRPATATGRWSASSMNLSPPASRWSWM